MGIAEVSFIAMLIQELLIPAGPVSSEHLPLALSWLSMSFHSIYFYEEPGSGGKGKCTYTHIHAIGKNKLFISPSGRYSTLSTHHTEHQ